MASKSKKPVSDRDIAFWPAYLEILNERVPLVDRWRDGRQTWHPRVVQKLLWYSDVPNTPLNRVMAYDWLMDHAARPATKSNKRKTPKALTRHTAPRRM